MHRTSDVKSDEAMARIGSDDCTDAEAEAIVADMAARDEAPMHCTEYVDGDPSGCARCGERKDLHETAQPKVEVGYKRLQHYAGQRPTRVTYAGAMKQQDGTVAFCGHELHRTPEAAVKCARKSTKLAARS